MEEIKFNSERWFDLTPLLNEIFIEIPNYEGKYQVSNYGRVKSVKRKLLQYDGSGYSVHNYKERILSLSKHKQGYLLVNLSKNGKGHIFQVHRLVAQAFIPNPNNYPEVNHKKGNKQDNRVCELEWCTRLYNQQEAERLNLINSPMRKKGFGHPTNKKICMLDEKGNTIKEYYSVTTASNIIGVKLDHLSYCARKHRKDKKTNHYWKYKEENHG